MLRKLLGVDVKMRQYAEGRKFVHAVVERIGMDGFNKIWQSPLTIPRLDELSDPDAWVVRVHGSGALNRPVAIPPVAQAATGTTVQSPAASPAKAGVVEVPPAPVPTLPEPVETASAEAGVAEPTEVAGLSAEEATATPPVTTVTTTVEPVDEAVPAEAEPAAKADEGDEGDGTQERPAKSDTTG
ncbi:hypothetical protein GCM10027610_126690 [Dactylosporangium cerinum]